MIGELSKIEKISLIDSILQEYQEKSARWEALRRGVYVEGYLCNEIVKRIAPETPYGKDTTDQALAAIPELLQFKPRGVDVYNNHGWFGGPHNCPGRRIEVLRELKKVLIEKQLMEDTDEKT